VLKINDSKSAFIRLNQADRPRKSIEVPGIQHLSLQGLTAKTLLFSLFKDMKKTLLMKVR
jgi:hypothetical protein